MGVACGKEKLLIMENLLRPGCFYVVTQTQTAIKGVWWSLREDLAQGHRTREWQRQNGTQVRCLNHITPREFFP